MPRCCGATPAAGKKLFEKHMARYKGAAYVSRTSGFVPRPPRKPGPCFPRRDSYSVSAGSA